MKRRLNLWLVAGLVTVLVAFVSYYGWLVRFPAMRDVPWLSLLVFAAGLLLLGAGLRRAFCQPQFYRGRIAGPILALLSVAIFSFFVYDSFYYSRQIPAATGAPQANQKAPEFTLPDSNGAPVALSNLVGAQRWTLLVFYRGFW